MPHIVTFPARMLVTPALNNTAVTSFHSLRACDNAGTVTATVILFRKFAYTTGRAGNPLVVSGA